MDKYKTKRTINKWFLPIKLNELSLDAQKSIQSFDEYRKKLTFEQVIKFFLYAINGEKDSLHHMHQELRDVRPLKEVLDLDTIHYSQLSRTLKALDSSVLMEIFHQLLAQVHGKTQQSQKNNVYLRKLLVI
jgi:hypothetical protein